MAAGPLVGLYTNPAADDVYQSESTALAGGSVAGFSSLCLIKGAVAVPGGASDYMGNSNKSNAGYAFSRGTNAAASTPAGVRVNLQANVYYAGGVVTANAYIPVADFIGRTVLLGLTFTGSNGTLAFYLNGAALNTATSFAQTYVPGNSRFTYGGIVAGGAMEDRIVGGLYSTSLFSVATHAGIFDLVRASGGDVMAGLVRAGIAAEFAWDSWSTRRPYKAVAPVIVNGGSAGISGNLTFPVAATNKIVTNTDVNPQYTAGAAIA